MITQGDIWSEEEIALLRRRLAEGVTYIDIGRELGRSKNSCIGKSNRLGLMGKVPASERYGRRQAMERRMAKAQQEQQEHQRRIDAMAAKARREIERKLAKGEPLMVPLEALTERTCKWPFGVRAPYQFCGLPKQQIEGPYCREHDRVAFNRKGG